MKNLWVACALLFGFMIIAPAAHGILVPNLVADRSDSLPKGRFMVSAVQFFSTIDRRYDANGNVENIRDNFNRSLSWHDIVEDDPTRSAELTGLLHSQGVNLDDSAGNFNGSFRGRLQTIVPVVGYGITDRIGLFAALPIIKFQGEARVAYVATPSAQGLVNSLETNDMRGAAKEFAKALNNGFDDQLTQNGYEFKASENRTLIGDLQLVAPISFSERNAPLRFAMAPTLSVPTGSQADTSDLYRISSGTGSWTPGVKGICEWSAWGPVSLATSANIQVPLPHSTRGRVPRNSMTELIRDTDDLDYGTGLIYGTQVDARWQMSRSWRLRTGLQHQQALSRKVNGSRFSGDRYSILSDASRERLETAHLALELNSLQAFLDGDFLFPSQVSIAASWPLSGTNSLADPLYMVQLALFF